MPIFNEKTDEIIWGTIGNFVAAAVLSGVTAGLHYVGLQLEHWGLPRYVKVGNDALFFVLFMCDIIVVGGTVVTSTIKLLKD